MLIPDWVSDESVYLRRQIKQLRLSCDLLELANVELRECAEYWREKVEPKDTLFPKEVEDPGGDTSPGSP